MDDFEKRALRSKRKMIEDNVQLDDDLLSSLKRSGLLGNKEIDKILDRKNNHDRVGKLFEILFESSVANAFDSLCGAFSTQASWLSRDLQTDVQADRGNIKIDDDIWQEAGAIIHRKFAMNKRISDSDRDEMQQLLATKLQLAGDEWRAQARLVREEQQRTVAELRQRENELRAIDELLTTFLRDHDRQLTSYSHDMRTTRSVLDAKNNQNEEGAYGDIRAKVADLCKRVDIFLSDYELAMQNRRLCFEILGVQNFEGDSTYNALRARLATDSAQLNKVREELKESEIKRAQLRMMLSGNDVSDEDDSERDNYSAEQVEAMEREIKELRVENQRLNDQLKAISEKIRNQEGEENGTKDNGQFDLQSEVDASEFSSASTRTSTPRPISARTGSSQRGNSFIGSPKTQAHMVQRAGSPKTVAAKSATKSRKFSIT